MWRQGFQVAHVHHNAWLSGVYYLHLPGVIDDPDGNHGGWIKFGKGSDELYNLSEPLTRLIKPREGMMILFPSYLWHRTIPFDTDEERVCIAIDVERLVEGTPNNP